ncbi:MAG: HEAT repeat domain-containing protein [Candidatus Helarchaeota archaeon]|nr:HEAT repeat domain-containing protein [Candidatus Helarchaeota archaeon]
METPSKNLEFWFKQLEDSDPNKKIQAIEKLIELRHPKIVDILIEVAEAEKSETTRIIAIRALGKIEVSNHSEIFDILKNLLIGENPKIRKAVLRTIVDLGDVSAIKYLTKYYYSDHSVGIKPDVSKALADLSKVLDEIKKDSKLKKLNKKIIQKKLPGKSPKKENDIDYKKHIKKFFD